MIFLSRLRSTMYKFTVCQKEELVFRLVYYRELLLLERSRIIAPKLPQASSDKYSLLTPFAAKVDFSLHLEKQPLYHS